MTRILVVSPYAPYRDGIAAYAVQEVRWLRSQMEQVEVLSPSPSAAHHHLPLGQLSGLFGLLRIARRYDRLIVQYHPPLFFNGSSDSLAATLRWLALAVLVRLTDVEIRIHETNFSLNHYPNKLLSLGFLSGAAEITVHTIAERDRLVDESGLPAERFRVIEHGRSFMAHVSLGRQAARAELGLNQSALIFLSIGFLQEHKGFDRALEVFARSGIEGEYHVVGSARVDAPEIIDHVDRLRRLCSSIPGAHLHERFVSDVEFDAWIQAADVVVLPNREIWSSGVIERCALAGTPTIVRRVGGLEFQANESTRLVEDDNELLAALREAGASHIVIEAPVPTTREEAQELIRTRASGGVGSTTVPINPHLEALRQLPLAPIPQPTSSRIGIAVIKKLVQRLTAWQISPLVQQVTELQRRTVAAIESLDVNSARQGVD